MDMKRHMIICLFISMLVGREKELGSYKDRRYLLGMKHGSWAWIQSIYVIVYGIVQGGPRKIMPNLPYTNAF